MMRWVLVLAVLVAIGSLVWLWSTEPEGVERAMPLRPSSAVPVDESETLTAHEVVSPAPQAPQPLEARGVTLLIEHPDGSPARGAVVAVRQDSDSGFARLRRSVADESGAADFPDVSLDEPLHVWVAGVTFDVHYVRLGEVGEQCTVRLPRGAVISGIVRVDGKPPVHPLPIGLRVATADRRQIPTAVHVLLATMMSGTASRVRKGAMCADGGEFRITGCPSGWTGSLVFPNVLRTADGERSRRVVAPTRGLVLELITRPGLRVRFVDPGGTPLGGTLAEVEHSTSRERSLDSIVADSDGRSFWMFPQGLPSVSVTLAARSADGQFRRTLDLEELDTTNTHDLGDVVLQRGWTLQLDVIEPGGAPVAGARAHALREGPGDDAGLSGGGLFAVSYVIAPATILSAPTNAAGRTLLAPLLPEDVIVEVVPLRHTTAQALLPVPTDPSMPVPLVVTVERCAVLEVHAVDSSGVGLTGAHVRVDTVAALFEEADPLRGHPLRAQFGASAATKASARTAVENGMLVFEGTLKFPADVPVLLPCIKSGVAVEVSVESLAGVLLWGPESVTLAPGETRVLRAEVTHEVRDVRGVVLDPMRRPIVYAFVGTLTPRNDYGPQAQTGKDGSFELLGVDATRPMELEVDAPGFISRRLRRVALPPDGEPLVVMLEPAHTIVVHLVDAAGNPVSGARLVARATGWRDTSATGGPDTTSPYRLEGLPAGTVQIEVTLGDGNWLFQHDTADPVAQFEVSTER